MHRFEMERLAIQLWLCDFAVTLKFPGKNVGKIFVVAERFALRGLMLFSKMCAARFVAGERVKLTLDPKRYAYLVLATGAINVGGVRVEARDGAAITDLTTIEIVGIEDAEVVLVDAA